MPNTKMPTVVKMKAHLKSKNSSWCFKKKTKNLYFDNPLGFVFQNKKGTTLVFRGKKTFFKDMNLFEVKKKKLKKFFLVGYLSYEFDMPKISTDYQAIFNIYSDISTKIKKPKKNFIQKSYLEKTTTDTKFIKSVETMKKLISRGDIYQINLTREFTFNSHKNSYELFLDYFKCQPVEYGSYIEFHDHTILSGSMELFLQKYKKKIITKPIKGTSKNSKADLNNLKTDIKEKAENLMIVDLMRNDLSTVCKPGSVTVDSLFKIKKYSTLTQLESTISGNLRHNVSLYKIFKNTMPPGSVTGTPKKKAEEIISQVEKHQRGPYCGAVGYIDPKDNFCFSVGIRLSKINNQRKSFYTGAGIVWDSKPKKENLETHLKAKAFQNTLSNL